MLLGVYLCKSLGDRGFPRPHWTCEPADGVFIIRSNPVVQLLKNLGSSTRETGGNTDAIEAAIRLWTEFDIKVGYWPSHSA